MRPLLLLLFTALFLSTALGQSPPVNRPASDQSITGSVVDSLTRKPLLEASVSLLSARDSSLITFGITDGDGRFTFPKLAEGQYRVLVTYVGYRSRSRRVSVTSANPNPDAGTLELVSQTQTLAEVAVQGERAPIAVKGDTLEFNAGSFKTKPNAQVEDLLKKLPGVEVDRDGTVKAQGQEVKKVLIDGKPFFGNDPKMATRNLPADIIDKVQLYDQQSEQSQFSGVDDGDREKTINITTKKDKRKGTFGQQSIGVGPKPDDDARYSAGISLNRFNNGRQISVIGMANNLNRQGFTAQDLGLGSNFNAGNQGGGGNFTRGGGQGGGSFGGNGQQVGNNAITQSWAGGINYRDAWGKKIDVAGSYNVSNTNTITDQQSRRQNVLPTTLETDSSAISRADSSFVTDRKNGSDNGNTNHRANLRIDYRLDSLTTIRIIPNLSWLQSNYRNNSRAATFDGSGDTLNTSRTNYNSTGEGFSGNNSLLLLRKFRKRGRTVSVNWNVSMNNQDNLGINQSINTFAQSTAPISTTGLSTTAVPGSQTATNGLFARNINQQNDQQTRSMTNSVNLSYTEPLSLRQTLEFHYTLSNNRNTSDRVVSDFNETTGRYDLRNTRLSNDFVNTYMTNRGGLTWQTRRLKYNYAFGIDAQQASLRSNNLGDDVNGRVDLSRTFTNLLPNALFTYNFAKNRTLRINYRTRTNAPSVNQLQPVADNTNPLNIRLGNTELQPEYSHNLSLNFNRFEPTTFRSLFASLNASRTDNKIVNATSFNRSGAQTTQPINTNGYYNVSGFLVLGRPLMFSQQRVNLNLTSNVTYNRGTSFVNSQPNRSQNWLVGQRVGVTTNIDEKLDLNLSGNINLQSARYSLQPNQNTTFLNQTVTFDVFYQLPLNFTFSTDVYYNHYGGNSGSYNQSFTLWNAALSRQLFKQKQGELRLQVFDLLNQNQSIVRNVTDTYTEEVQSRVLNRYFLISFVYNIRRFGAGPPNRSTDGGDRQYRRMNREFTPGGGPGNGGGFRRNQ